MTDNLEDAHARIIELQGMNSQLIERIRALEQQARHDPMTDLFNRRAANQALREARERCIRHGVPYSVIMIDLDHFKRVNDEPDWGGHANGDRVLIKVADLIRQVLRKNDQGVRWGGEEFMIITENDARGAVVLAERLREEIELQVKADPMETVAQTASFGVAESSGGLDKPMDVVRNADQALYRAKEDGRNRVGV